MFFRCAAALVLGVIATTAEAKCTRLGFSVNDYGKDGPTKDAQALLDTYIAKWAVQNNIKTYTTGKKDVKCALFLDFGVFDEHTCRAEASVCWGVTTAAEAAPVQGTTAKRIKKAAAPAEATAADPAAKPAAEPAATLAAEPARESAPKPQG